MWHTVLPKDGTSCARVSDVCNGVFGLQARYVYLYVYVYIHTICIVYYSCVDGPCTAAASLEAESAGLLYSNEELLVQHRVGRVRRKIKAVKAGVSPETNHT